MKNSMIGIMYTAFAVCCLISLGHGNYISVNLAGYTPNTENYVFQKYLNVDHDTTEIDINNIGNDVGFFVIQVHSYVENVTLSYNSTLQLHSYVTGTNIGLIYGYGETSATFYLFRNIKYYDYVSLLLVVTVYDSYAPIPGGCNLSLQTMYAPYQIVSYNDEYITVDSQPPWAYGTNCDENFLHVDLYHIFLDEYDKSESGYFEGIRKMLTVENIIKYGRKVSSVSGFPHHKLYSSYRGTGEVFAMVATLQSLGTNSSYIPAVSYGCDLSNWDESCIGPISRYWKFFCAVLLIFGLLLCFYGHRFFKFTLFLMGFTFGIFMTYFVIMMDGHFDLDETMITSVVIAFFYGIIWLFIWWKFGIPVLSVNITFILAGFLIASVIFYAGLADVYLYRSNSIFWVTFLCIILICMIVGIPVTMYGHIFGCSLLGSYSFIAALNYYLGGNLQYIVINTYRRATVWNFDKAVVSPPFQIIDIGHCVAWVVLLLSGCYVQIRDQRGKPPFPPNRNGEVLASRTTERTPLIPPETVTPPQYV